MKKRIYISGPMTGIPDNNFPAFFAMEERIRAAGDLPVNPARFPVQPTYDDTIRLDLEVIAMAADGAVFLRGWEHSKGANIEMDLIRSIGIPVMFEEQMTTDSDVSDLSDVSDNKRRRTDDQY